MMFSRRVTAIVAMALLAPAALAASNRVMLTSAVFVEKDLTDAQGRNRIVLEPPRLVAPGDRLVFLLRYRNTGTAPASDFIVTNPLPETVSYQGTPDARAIVSIDGGRSWGALPRLRVRERDGSVRAARPEDVTHVRWTLKQAIPAGSEGRLVFRGVVK